MKSRKRKIVYINYILANDKSRSFAELAEMNWFALAAICDNIRRKKEKCSS